MTDSLDVTSTAPVDTPVQPSTQVSVEGHTEPSLPPSNNSANTTTSNAPIDNNPIITPPNLKPLSIGIPSAPIKNAIDANREITSDVDVTEASQANQVPEDIVYDAAHLNLQEGNEHWKGHAAIEERKQFYADLLNNKFISDPSVAEFILNDSVELVQNLLNEHFSNVAEANAESLALQSKALNRMISSDAELKNIEFKTDIAFISDSPNAAIYRASLTHLPVFKMFMAENKHLLKDIGHESVENMMYSDKYSIEDQKKIYKEELKKWESSGKFDPKMAQVLMDCRKHLYGN